MSGNAMSIYITIPIGKFVSIYQLIFRDASIPYCIMSRDNCIDKVHLSFYVLCHLSRLNVILIWTRQSWLNFVKRKGSGLRHTALSRAQLVSRPSTKKNLPNHSRTPKLRNWRTSTASLWRRSFSDTWWASGYFPARKLSKVGMCSAENFRTNWKFLWTPSRTQR